MSIKSLVVGKISGSEQMDDQKKSFVHEAVQSLPGALLVISVALAAYFMAPLLLKYPIFKTYLSLKDFILVLPSRGIAAKILKNSPCPVFTVV